MFKERTLFCFLLALGIATVISVNRPEGIIVNKEMSEAVFYANRLAREAEYDMILLGDSRTRMSLSAKYINATIPEYRITNFGFVACALDATYLADASSRLDPTSKHQVLVIGLTPLSFTEWAMQHSRYRKHHNIPYIDRYILRHLGWLFLFFEPQSVIDTLIYLKMSSSMLFSTKPHDVDLASYRAEPKFDPLWEVNRYRRELFSTTDLRENTIKEFLAATRSWVKKGIVVIGYRPATTDAMVEVEDQLSGLDYDKLIQDFKQAGGRWIKVENIYHCYDGSHIHKDDIPRYSSDLAAKIAEILAKEKEERRAMF